jgi:hypothetical protein
VPSSFITVFELRHVLYSVDVDEVSKVGKDGMLIVLDKVPTEIVGEGIAGMDLSLLHRSSERTFM